MSTCLRLDNTALGSDTCGSRMAREWSLVENEATVADYLTMLKRYLRREPFNKADHHRALRALLDDRTEKAIEWKHRNISAILMDLGQLYIPGYTPAFNYQQLLREVVEDWIATDSELAGLSETHVDAAPPTPTIVDILATLVEPPPPQGPSDYRVEQATVRRRPVDHLAREARNADLGLRGEEYVLGFERARLIRAGKATLADRVEHTSRVEGDGAGFDVRSYETNGSDRFIEVKTTAYGIYTPVYLSRNELLTSRRLDMRYHLYRAFQFREAPRIFTVPGPLDRTCRIEPTQYLGRLA